MNNKIWFNPKISRYFLIENSLNIAHGNFTIINIDNEEKQVNEQDIIAFEITELQAQSYIENEIKEVIETLKIPITELIKSSLSENTLNFNSEDFIINLIAQLTNTTPEELEQNTQLAQIGLQKLMKDFKQVLDNSLGGNSNNLKTSVDKMKSLQELLKNQGMDLGDLLEKFPENLQKLTLLSNFSAVDTTTKLQEFSQSITQDQEDFSQMLMKFVESYKRLFIDKETAEEKQAKREAEYKKIADQAIKDSLAKYPMPSLKFEDLLPKKEQS
jgi:hypothetical protein